MLRNSALQPGDQGLSAVRSGCLRRRYVHDARDTRRRQRRPVRIGTRVRRGSRSQRTRRNHERVRAGLARRGPHDLGQVAVRHVPSSRPRANSRTQRGIDTRTQRLDERTQALTRLCGSLLQEGTPHRRRDRIRNREECAHTRSTQLLKRRGQRALIRTHPRLIRDHAHIVATVRHRRRHTRNRSTRQGHSVLRARRSNRACLARLLCVSTIQAQHNIRPRPGERIHPINGNDRDREARLLREGLRHLSGQLRTAHEGNRHRVRARPRAGSIERARNPFFFDPLPRNNGGTERILGCTRRH